MTPNEGWFESYKSIDGGQVFLGITKLVKSLVLARIKMFDGSERVLKEVRHVPKLQRNLISLGTLDQEGSSYKCEGGVLKVLRGSLVTNENEEFNQF